MRAYAAQELINQGCSSERVKANLRFETNLVINEVRGVEFQAEGM